MVEAQSTSSEPSGPDGEPIEVRVTELKQLFNAMDASPFRKRDLDPDAEEFIVGWAREVPRDAKLALLVNLSRDPPPTGLHDEPAALRDAIHEFFTHRAWVSRGRLRQLLRIGRISLLVGCVFLSAAVGLGHLIVSLMKGHQLGELLREGLVICGWVAMWRPLEILLYGWWPIRTDAILYDRLSAMPVTIKYEGNAPPGAWQYDWPTVSAEPATPQKTPPPHAAGPRSVPEPPTGAVAMPERGAVVESIPSIAADHDPTTGKTKR